ncbi:MAG: hypothetical protein HDT47_00400 [Ruminococcaceae bacterium]|nr:hypothetical protein [Oscillospiraceae bacterium]
MFCTKCGKEIPEGGVCSCSAEQPAQQTPVQQAEPVQQVQPVQTGQSSKLPDGQAIAESAKKAANAIKSSPIFSEIFGTLKGVVISPVKQVSSNAARNDILWIFLSVIEALLIAFSSTTLVRRSVFSVFASMGLGIKYGDYSKGLKEVGASAVKMYFMNLLAAVICIVVAIAVIKLLMVICKKNASFFAVANMITTAFLPFTMLVTVGAILSMIYAPIGLILTVIAFFTLAVLGYVGIQKLDKFTSSPFWQYIICTAVILIIAASSQGVILNSIVSGIVESAFGSLMGGFGSFF